MTKEEASGVYIKYVVSTPGGTFIALSDARGVSLRGYTRGAALKVVRAEYGIPRDNYGHAIFETRLSDFDAFMAEVEARAI